MSDPICLISTWFWWWRFSVSEQREWRWLQAHTVVTQNARTVKHDISFLLSSVANIFSSSCCFGSVRTPHSFMDHSIRLCPESLWCFCTVCLSACLSACLQPTTGAEWRKSIGRSFSVLHLMNLLKQYSVCRSYMMNHSPFAGSKCLCWFATEEESWKLLLFPSVETLPSSLSFDILWFWTFSQWNQLLLSGLLCGSSSSGTVDSLHIRLLRVCRRAWHAPFYLSIYLFKEQMFQSRQLVCQYLCPSGLHEFTCEVCYRQIFLRGTDMGSLSHVLSKNGCIVWAITAIIFYIQQMKGI